MKRTMVVVLGVLAAGASLMGQGPGMMGRGGMGGKGMGGQKGAACCDGDKAPIAGSPVVDLKGKITRVQITPGGGMPFIEVKVGDKTSKVHLGSMPYLMSQGFSPKVDDEAEVKAYKMNDEFVGISVTLPKQNKTLKLRDDNGLPLWRGGVRGPAAK